MLISGLLCYNVEGGAVSEHEAVVKLDSKSARFLEEVLRITPYTRAEIVASGVVGKAVERLMELKNRGEELSNKHGSLDGLEKEIKASGVPPSNHTLYNELIEWRAIKGEMEELKRFLEQL